MTIQGGNGPKVPRPAARAATPAAQPANVDAPSSSAAGPPGHSLRDQFDQTGPVASPFGHSEASLPSDLGDALAGSGHEGERRPAQRSRTAMLQQAQLRLVAEQQAVRSRADEIFHALVEVEFAPEARESLRVELERLRARTGTLRRRLADVRRRLHMVGVDSSFGGELPGRRAGHVTLEERARTGSMAQRGSAALALARQSLPRNRDGTRAHALRIEVPVGQDRTRFGSDLAHFSLDSAISQQIASQLGWPGGVTPLRQTHEAGPTLEHLTSLSTLLTSSAEGPGA